MKSYPAGCCLTCCIALIRSGDVGPDISGKKVDRSDSREEEDDLGDGSAHYQNYETRIEKEVSDSEWVCSLNDSIDLKTRDKDVLRIPWCVAH